MPAQLIDIHGQEFGRMKVIAREKGKWVCLCQCGNKKAIDSSSLRSGRARSCGCLNSERARERATSHGMAGTSIYAIWVGLKLRCTATQGKAYQDYASRGITVCDRWQSFENFLSDMGPRPSNAHSIDRLNNDAGYAPDNCRWATASEQMRNRRVPRANTTGLTGVSFHKGMRRYQAAIGIAGKRGNAKFLGTFDNIFDAAAARISAENRYWTESSNFS